MRDGTCPENFPTWVLLLSDMVYGRYQETETKRIGGVEESDDSISA